ncbi:MAG: hypothetical protein ACRD4L_15065 [Pyrinomonadaceae bacterium]
MIETPLDINPADLYESERIGITAGASTPAWLIEQVIERVCAIGVSLGKPVDIIRNN